MTGDIESFSGDPGEQAETKILAFIKRIPKAQEVVCCMCWMEKVVSFLSNMRIYIYILEPSHTTIETNSQTVGHTSQSGCTPKNYVRNVAYCIFSADVTKCIQHLSVVLTMSILPELLPTPVWASARLLVICCTPLSAFDTRNLSLRMSHLSKCAKMNDWLNEQLLVNYDRQHVVSMPPLLILSHPVTLLFPHRFLLCSLFLYAIDSIK